MAATPPAREAHGPRHTGPISDDAVPFFANLRQIIGPYIGRTTSVGAECNDDIMIWEPGFRVSQADRIRIVRKSLCRG